MKFWCLQLSPKDNQILDRFLPYEARAEICQKFGWLLGRFEATKNLFFDEMTFRVLTTTNENKTFYQKFRIG